MGVILLLVFVLGLFLLPVAYAQRTRRQWWRDLCAHGTLAEGLILAVTPLPRRYNGLWFSVRFEFSRPEYETKIQARVAVRAAQVRAHTLAIGCPVAIRYYRVMPTDAALALVQCQPHRDGGRVR